MARSMTLGPGTRNLLIAAAAILLVAGLGGFFRFKKFVDEDPRLCATCHRASPEFSLWLQGSHKSVSCQKCHHSTQEQGVAMLRAFLAGKTPAGRHAEVEVGACAACHLSHDPRWPQVGGLARPPHPLREPEDRLREVPRRQRPRLRAGLQPPASGATASTWWAWPA